MLKNSCQRLPNSFADEGLSIPLVTTPTSFLDPEDPDVQRVYAACGEAGVANLKVGYWHWSKEDGGYWALVDRIRESPQRISSSLRETRCPNLPPQPFRDFDGVELIRRDEPRRGV